MTAFNDVGDGAAADNDDDDDDDGGGDDDDGDGDDNDRRGRFVRDVLSAIIYHVTDFVVVVGHGVPPERVLDGLAGVQPLSAGACDCEDEFEDGA